MTEPSPPPVASSASPSPAPVSPAGAGGGGTAGAARVTGLLRLEKRVRQAKRLQELAFVLVNETHLLIPCRQAALWQADTGRVLALSGVAGVDPDVPFVRWLGGLFRHLEAAHPQMAASGPASGSQAGAETGGPVLLTAADLPAGPAADWDEWLPAHGVWLPLVAPHEGRLLGALLLARESVWTPAERVLLSHLMETFAHAWAALPEWRHRPWRRWLGRRRRLLLAAAAAAALAAGLIPVRLSVLAPAEVVGADPMAVRAPFEGVIERMVVQPNQRVAEGEPLLVFDPSRLRNRLDVALKGLEIAEAELRQGQQQALFDARAKAGLAVLQGRRDQQAAEVAYVGGLLERAEIKAPRAGIAVFDAVSDWVGKPVTVGERILLIADPERVELEIDLPIDDAVVLEPGADVSLFLNTAPHQPLPARLTGTSYKARVTDHGVLAYRLRAGFVAPAEAGGVETAPAPRLGLKGVARLYGPPVTLAYYVLRRPLAAARLWLGV